MHHGQVCPQLGPCVWPQLLLEHAHQAKISTGSTAFLIMIKPSTQRLNTSCIANTVKRVGNWHACYVKGSLPEVHAQGLAQHVVVGV